MSPLSIVRRAPHLPAWALAVAGPLLFGLLDIAAVLTEGQGRASLLNPIGLAAIALADRAHVFDAYVAGKVAVVCLCAWCAYLACAGRPRWRTLLLEGQLACALALDSLVFNLLVSAQFALLLPLRTGLRWLALQYALGVACDAVLVALAEQFTLERRLSMLAYLSAERLLIGAAFFVALLVLRERRARVALAEAHAQVLATQALLGETVRGAERLRIARDLHDTLGHHLTALTLHLDLAQRQAGAAAPAALGTAHTLGRELLAQVREVVSDARHDHAIDLAAALRVLCDGLPTLRTELAIDAAAAQHPPHVAHTLFCCIQEAATNALRHAQATHLCVSLETQAGATVARVRDDGAGRAGYAEGNGLRGMRERLAALGGTLSIVARDGFALEMRIPHQGGAA